MHGQLMLKGIGWFRVTVIALLAIVCMSWFASAAFASQDGRTAQAQEGIAAAAGVNDAGAAIASAADEEASWTDRVSEWLTSPVAITVILIIGIAGIAIEMLLPGFTIPGLVGIAAFVLYFVTHYTQGYAEQQSLLLFIAGIVLLASELFIPSFGILGALGTISLGAGVLTASEDEATALYALLIAASVAAVIVYAFAKKFSHRGIWNKLILRDKLTTEQGYVSNPTRAGLEGKLGLTVTPLRPAGAIELDGERIDVVTDGVFIEAGVQVIVVHAEGARVVVKAAIT